MAYALTNTASPTQLDDGHRAEAPSILARAARMLRLWDARMRERQELANWDERDLRDARISRSELDYEMAKPFWRG